jgi:hypothetical protein
MRVQASVPASSQLVIAQCKVITVEKDVHRGSAMCACMELVYRIAFAFVSIVVEAYISSQSQDTHLNVATFQRLDQ